MGYGHGSHFVAHLDKNYCSHCKNTAVTQLYAAYSSEMMLGVTEYSYNGISVVCPVCHYGYNIKFTPFNSRFFNLIAGKKAKEERAIALDTLKNLEKHINIDETRKFYENLNLLNRNDYRKMLKQIQLSNLLDRLKNKPAQL